MKKIVITGVHGTGKTKICKEVYNKIKEKLGRNEYSFYVTDKLCFDHKNNLKSYGGKDKFKLGYIPEQFREVVKNIPNFTQQTEEITLATYAKQLYLENLYTAQGKNILCDRSVLDTFIYFDYYNNVNYRYSLKYGRYGHYNNPDHRGNYCFETNDFCKHIQSAAVTLKTYSKIYLIEPSDREIEDDGFRLTDKKQQLEIHKLFLEYFKDFCNVEIINQEDAHKEEFIDSVVSDFVL